jgi:hypothetical protein
MQGYLDAAIGRRSECDDAVLSVQKSRALRDPRVSVRLEASWIASRVCVRKV